MALYGSKFKIVLSFILLLVSCNSVKTNASQSPRPTSTERFKVNIPDAQLEAERIWRHIIDISFFEQYNYSVSLPEGELIENLKNKSRNKQLSDADFEALKRYIREEIYDIADYQKGYQKIVK